jgi:hypothetical protein
VRVGRGEHVEAVDLVVEDHLTLDRQPVDEVVDRLGAVGRAMVDGLEVRHVRRIAAGTDKVVGSRPGERVRLDSGDLAEPDHGILIAPCRRTEKHKRPVEAGLETRTLDETPGWLSRLTAYSRRSRAWQLRAHELSGRSLTGSPLEPEHTADA